MKATRQQQQERGQGGRDHREQPVRADRTPWKHQRDGYRNRNQREQDHRLHAVVARETASVGPQPTRCGPDGHADKNAAATARPQERVRSIRAHNQQWRERCRQEDITVVADVPQQWNLDDHRRRQRAKRDSHQDRGPDSARQHATALQQLLRRRYGRRRQHEAKQMKPRLDGPGRQRTEKESDRFSATGELEVRLVIERERLCQCL